MMNNNIWPNISGYFTPGEDNSVLCLDVQEPLVKRLKETFPKDLGVILAKANAISNETNSRCLVTFMAKPSSSELAKVITSSYHIDSKTSVLMENRHFSIVLDNGETLEGERTPSCAILDDGTTAYVVNVFLDN